MDKTMQLLKLVFIIVIVIKLIVTNGLLLEAKRLIIHFENRKRIL